MKRCSLQNPDDMTNTRYDALHTGLYDERSYAAMSAFLLLYNRDLYEIHLSIGGMAIAKDIFLRDFPRIGCVGDRLFYNVFISPDGELIIDCRREFNLKEKLFSAIANMHKALLDVCVSNRIKLEDANFKIYEAVGCHVFDFSPTSLKELAQDIDKGADDGKPNDFIIVERNRLMQTEFWRLKNRLRKNEVKIYAHKLFNRNDKYKDFRFNADMVMRPLREIDKELYDDIHKYLKEVDKQETLLESPAYVVGSLFSRFQ